MSLYEAVLAALLLAAAGAAHCLGMCGAISVSLGFSLPDRARGTAGLAYWHGLFALGRVTTYALLGALGGAFGEALRLLPGGGRIVMGIAIAIMLMVAFALLGRDLGLRHIERLGMRLWRAVQPLLQQLLPVRRTWQALVVGMLWGLLPCGLVYSALLLAVATGDALTGAVTMLVFGLVTVVPVAGTGLVAGAFPWLRSPAWRRVAGILSLALVAWMLVQMSGGHGVHGPDTPHGELGRSIHEMRTPHDEIQPPSHH